MDRDLFRCDVDIIKLFVGNDIYKNLIVRIEILNIDLNRTFSINYCYKVVDRVILSDMLTY